MRLHIAVLGVYLLTCSLLFGQTIPVYDDSSAGSPVSITGTVTLFFGFTSFLSPDSSTVDCSITGHNHASKSIIMSVVELKLTQPSGVLGESTFQRDVFFKPLTISLPNSDFTMWDPAMGTAFDVPGTPTTPEAHAKVIFLQFEDGSMWGDANAAARLIEKRPAVLAFLESLKSSYSTDGPDGLEKALARDPKPGTRSWGELAYLRMIRDQAGINAVAETVDQQLATAERRKGTLKLGDVGMSVP